MRLRILILFCSVALLSACNNNNANLGTNIRQAETSTSISVSLKDGESSQNPIAVSDDGEVRLLPGDKQSGKYDGMILEFEGEQRQFDWAIPIVEENKQQVLYTDVTGDDKKEAVVILNTGSGTELNLQEVHVVRPDDFSEIKVQDPEGILATNVITSVTKDSNALSILVQMNGVTQCEINGRTQGQGISGSSKLWCNNVF